MDLYQGLNTAPAHSQSQFYGQQSSDYIRQQSKDNKQEKQKPHTTKNENAQQFV